MEKELIKLEMEMAEETGTHTGYSEETFFLFSGILDAIQVSKSIRCSPLQISNTGIQSVSRDFRQILMFFAILSWFYIQ